MIVKEYIKDFEKLGFGMFVHFGPYSVIGRGEWAKKTHNISWDEYMKAVQAFNPKPTWAAELAQAAKEAGARYITLTTRHHDGFSLYDTKGLNDYDAPHVCGRDLVREFVDACRAEGIIPFFYHTLLDWHEESYQTDFPQYLSYLRESVKIICTEYDKIGGIWFDGMWDKKDADWEEDALYGMIRSYQPEAMIINNTGLSELGALGHIELDSVTFERGKPKPINLEGSPKYIASEMCQIFADHWGYAAGDLNFHAPADFIGDLCVCRRYGSNFLLNVGPMGDGSIRLIDRAMMQILGEWVAINGEILPARPCGIAVENAESDFILEKDGCYYLVCDRVPMVSDPNVALRRRVDDFKRRFRMEKEITSMTWMDDDTPVDFTQDEDGTVTAMVRPFEYGRSLVVRVAKIYTE